MRGIKRRSDSGFTLIELLVVIAIIVTLSTLAIQWYELYKKRAWDTHTELKLGEIRRALENGRLETPLTDPPRFFWTWTNTAGPVVDGDARDFLPNLWNESGMQISVNRDDWCESGLWGDWCVAEWASIRHCKGRKMISYWRLHGGGYWITEWDNDMGC